MRVVGLVSDLYRNPPMGPQDQPDYVNAVAAVLTTAGAARMRCWTGCRPSSAPAGGSADAAGDRWGPRVSSTWIS